MKARLASSGLLAALMVALAAVSAAAQRIDGSAAARERELTRLVRQDCGSCHGMQLTGGLGPPLTPQALRDKPVASLVATVLSGRPGTAMPPWRAFVSESEAAWIVARLREGNLDAR